MVYIYVLREAKIYHRKKWKRNENKNVREREREEERESERDWFYRD